MMKAKALQLEDTYLWEYYQAIVKGDILACWAMTTELENLIEDYHDPQYKYNTTMSYIYIDFIENCVKHAEPPFYGKPFLLMTWQKALIEVMFSFKMISIDNGRWVRRFVEVLLWIARKNGKTTFIAAIELAAMFLMNAGSLIVCSGMDDNTADLCYSKVNDMRLFIDPNQAMTWKNQKGIKSLLNSNFIKKISEKTKSREGRNVVLFGIDEFWSIADDDGIYNPLRQSASTQPEYLGCLFGSEGTIIDGLGDRKKREYLKIIKKEDTSESSKRKLPWIYEMDNVKECFQTDENGITRNWQKANPALGEAKLYSFMRDLCDEAKTNTATRLTFLTKDCNIKQGSVKLWLPTAYFNYDSNFDLADFKNYWCVGSVDLAETTDLCSAKIYFIKKDSRYKYVHSHYWIPSGKLKHSKDETAGAKYEEWCQKGMMTIVEGNDIPDLGVVADWFYELATTYRINIYKIGYDQKFKNDFIKRCEYYGWSDKSDLIMIQQAAEVLHTANNQLEADLRDHLIIGLNPVDKWCLSNAGLKIDGKGKSLVIKSERSHRIDGVVTLVMCQEMLNRYRGDYIDRLPDGGE